MEREVCFVITFKLRSGLRLVDFTGVTRRIENAIRRSGLISQRGGFFSDFSVEAITGVREVEEDEDRRIPADHAD